MAPARDHSEVIRPAAVLDERAAMMVLNELRTRDIATGGVWNASSALWQRYDRPWDGVGGSRGNAQLVGSIAVMYDAPYRHEITIFKVTVVGAAVDAGWTVSALCDDALQYAGLSLDRCPRAELTDTNSHDPFRVRA